MKVMFACLADYAAADAMGKLNVQGIFDTIHAPGFPTTHSRMYLVFRLMSEYDDNNTSRHLEIELIDADGKASFGTKADVRPPKVLPGGFVTHNQIMELNSVTIVSQGRYTFVLKLDGQEAFKVPFEARKQ